MFRETDPATSRESAARVKEFQTEHHAAILHALSVFVEPLAAEQISDVLGDLDKVQVGKRMSELERAGLVVLTSERHVNRSGRGGLRYRLARGLS